MGCFRERVKGIQAALARITLAAPATVAPGQAAVFYAGERVLGGGIIAGASVDSRGARDVSPAA
jgi:hypothetical protein